MRRRALFTVTVALAGAASVVLAGCGAGSRGDASATASPGSSSASLTGQITVLAAASLTESFTTLGRQFEAAHPGSKVTFGFAASSTLATQITQGAPADVFASASPVNMTQVVDAKAATVPVTFARNVLEVAVPPANPAEITQLPDLARPGVKVAVCVEAVPCGAGAKEVFAKAELTVVPATVEPDVKATLSKVTLGEVDAGVVWATDVIAAGSAVRGIPIPADLNYSSSYPIATLTASENPALAQAFVDYVRSVDGATVLSSAGFEKP